MSVHALSAFINPHCSSLVNPDSRFLTPNEGLHRRKLIVNLALNVIIVYDYFLTLVLFQISLIFFTQNVVLRIGVVLLIRL